MALDTLILGPFVFTDFRIPERMPFGGRQQLVVHKMPGGSRTIDAMGPDDSDRSWSGILWGDNAQSDMQTLDAMRRQGSELPFSWGAESRTAVISDFRAEVEKWTCIHYSITITLTDGGDAGGPLASLTSMIGADLSAALALVS